MGAFNLSKTEFIAYLECPMKFYIIKSMNYGLPFGSRGERDYSSHPEEAQESMWWHEYFEKFHDLYFDDIRENEPAPKMKTEKDTRILKMFYEKEQERYKQQPHYWFPLVTEQYLETEHFRGELDRINQLNERRECLLLEYKRNKKPYDEQELLFYACLIKQLNGQILEDEEPINITEIELYYFLTGETMRKKITDKELTAFEDYMQAIRKEMLTPNWVRKEDCLVLHSNCKYARICHCIPEKVRLLNQSQKTEE
jgi:hypothetical protein